MIADHLFRRPAVAPVRLSEPKRGRGKPLPQQARNWRMIFEFEGQDVTNVDLVDYH